MHSGVAMCPTDYAIRPDDLTPAIEERGFEALWVPEHPHIPASRRSPWPGGPDLPRDYWHCFVALTAAAIVTTRLKLGTSICLVIERDPIVTAKEVASLDRLSNRRFFGIAGGSTLRPRGDQAAMVAGGAMLLESPGREMHLPEVDARIRYAALRGCSSSVARTGGAVEGTLGTGEPGSQSDSRAFLGCSDLHGCVTSSTRSQMGRATATR
jgi:hypothetical protein